MQSEILRMFLLEMGSTMALRSHTLYPPVTDSVHSSLKEGLCEKVWLSEV